MLKSKLQFTGKIFFFFTIIILIPFLVVSQNLNSSNDNFSNYLDANITFTSKKIKFSKERH